MAISSGTILRVVASFLFPDSVIAQNVFNVVVTDLVTSDDEDDVILDCVDWCEAMFTHIIAHLASGISTSDIKVYEYDSVDDDWDEIGTGNWSVTFTGAAEMLPHGVAAVIHMRTQDPDTQGTKYVGGMVESATVNSDIGAGVLALLVDWLEEWYTPFTGTATGGTFAPVVWSPTDTVARATIESGYVNGQVGYQRRRKPGVGS